MPEYPRVVDDPAMIRLSFLSVLLQHMSDADKRVMLGTCAARLRKVARGHGTRCLGCGRPRQQCACARLAVRSAPPGGLGGQASLGKA